PKGIAIEHHSAVTMLRWARQVYSDADLGGMLFAASICFDTSVFELFAPLSWGGKVILAENVLALPNLPAAEEVTLLEVVPSAFIELLRSQGIPPSVRTLNLPGEPVQQSLVDAAHAQGSIERV